MAAVSEIYVECVDLLRAMYGYIKQVRDRMLNDTNT